MSEPAGRAPRGEARRALIIETALRVVGEEGPSALTHRRVAERAGVPLAATTYWFASKDELLVEAYKLAAARDVERVRRVADSYAGGDLARTILDLLGAELEDGRTALIASFTMWLEAARRPELRAIEAEWTDAHVGAITTLLKTAGSPRPALDARILTAALDGLLLEHLARGGGASDVRRALLRPVKRLIEALT